MSLDELIKLAEALDEEEEEESESLSPEDVALLAALLEGEDEEVNDYDQLADNLIITAGLLKLAETPWHKALWEAMKKRKGAIGAAAGTGAAGALLGYLLGKRKKRK